MLLGEQDTAARSEEIRDFLLAQPNEESDD
jgi:hypothetical protein